jgi:hypothetical protein
VLHHGGQDWLLCGCKIGVRQGERHLKGGGEMFGCRA